MVKGGAEVRLSKRAGQIITIDDLVDEVGVDAARYSLIRYPVDSPLVLDIDLLLKRSNDNPVFYVQYGSARIASVLRNAAELGIDWRESPFDPALLTHERENDLLGVLAEFPRVVASAAELREPHRVARYLEGLATSYHRFYDTCRVLPMGDEPAAPLHVARLWLCAATRQVFVNGLGPARSQRARADVAVLGTPSPIPVPARTRLTGPPSAWRARGRAYRACGRACRCGGGHGSSMGPPGSHVHRGESASRAQGHPGRSRPVADASSGGPRGRLSVDGPDRDLARRRWPVVGRYAAFCVAVYGRYSRHRGAVLAGGLAFFGMLSLVPSVLTLGALVALLIDPTEFLADMRQALLDHPEAAEALTPIVNELTTISTAASSLGMAGLIGLAGMLGLGFSLYAASRFVYVGRQVLDIAFEVEPRPPSLLARGISILITIIFQLGVLVGLAALSVVPRVLERLGLAAVYASESSLRLDSDRRPGGVPAAHGRHAATAPRCARCPG